MRYRIYPLAMLLVFLAFAAPASAQEQGAHQKLEGLAAHIHALNFEGGSSSVGPCHRASSRLLTCSLTETGVPTWENPFPGVEVSCDVAAYAYRQKTGAIFVSTASPIICRGEAP